MDADELGRARYAAARDAAQEANLSRCEGLKDDAVGITVDLNRRLQQAAGEDRDSSITTITER